MDPLNERTPSPTTRFETEFVKSVKKFIRRESQLSFLRTVKKEKLANTKILPSLTPRSNFKFRYNDLNELKDEKITRLKKEFLNLGILEAEREIEKMNSSLEQEYTMLPSKESTFPEFLQQTKEDLHHIEEKCRSKVKKKLEFYRRFKRQSVDPRMEHKKRSDRRCRQKERYKARSRENRRRKRQQKKDRTMEIINNIKSTNKVVNFSSMDIPNTAYLYLAKGMNFIPSYAGNKLDLKYDAMEFIRVLAWKHYFTNNPNVGDMEQEIPQFNKLRTKSYKHPATTHPLIDEIKFKLLAHIENLKIKKPTHNLTPGEIRGRNWLSKKLKEQRLFVTKADKGGATLIFDYSNVINIMEDELNDNTKYLIKKGDLTKSTTAKIKTLCSKLARKNYITTETNTLITGTTEGNIRQGMKQNAEYKAITPYAYPLFKIHSLSQEDFNNRIIPPFRLVYSMKFGPMYRMEKWISTLLTPMSKNYCKEEYIMDSDHIQNLLKDINENEQLNRNDHDYLLYTLDVKALYPSIQPNWALLALEDALAKEDMDGNTKIAIWKMVKFSFENAFIFYNKKSFKPIKGIPTGGSISRQIADIFLKWLIFIKLNRNFEFWDLIRNWWRFIDDVFGIWKGTKEQFALFVASINDLTKPCGIQFDKYEIGTLVNFLDMSIYLSYTADGRITINTKLYRKPTDAMRFLDRRSFHAPHTFSSIPFSQMLRTIKRNTEEVNQDKDLEELVKGFREAGYSEEELLKISENLGNRTVQNNLGVKTLIFSFKYFEECEQTKEFIKSLQVDIERLIGKTRIIFANRKGQNLGDICFKNRSLCIPEKMNQNQKCGNAKCKMCPSMIPEDTIIVNGEEFKLARNVTCNTENVIYYAKCKLCNENSSYFGRTFQRFNNRGSGHRSCFTPTEYEKSALSMHIMEDHNMDGGMESFNFAIVKKTHPLNLHREEYIHIEKARTKILGLNRMQVRH